MKKVTGVYKNIPKIIDSDKIDEKINYLKEIIQEIKKFFMINSENKKNQKDTLEFERKGKIFLNQMKKLTDFLEKDSLFKDKEYYDFLTIYDIAEYLFSDEELFFSNKKLIEEILTKFDNLIFYKLECVLNDCQPLNYDEKYKDFIYFLEDKEEYFLLEIYQYKGTDEELIKKIANKL